MQTQHTLKYSLNDKSSLEDSGLFAYNEKYLDLYPSDILHQWWCCLYEIYSTKYVLDKSQLYWAGDNNILSRVDLEKKTIYIYDEGKLVTDTAEFYQKIKTLITFT